MISSGQDFARVLDSLGLAVSLVKSKGLVVGIEANAVMLSPFIVEGSAVEFLIFISKDCLWTVDYSGEMWC